MIGRMMALALSLAAISASPVRAETVAVEGGQIWWQSCGRGPRSIVLLHDGVLDSASFDDLWGRLCRDFRVVRYDRRGYGRSPAATAPYSPEDDLAAVIGAAGLDHFILAGFSAGGGIALDYALDHPEAVDRLVLAGASVDGFKPSEQFVKRNEHIFLPMLFGMTSMVIANAAKDPYLLAPGHEAARERAVALAKANPQDLKHLLHDPVRPVPSVLPRLAGLRQPVLILVGDHDIADVQAMAGAVEVLAPHTERVVVPDAGHLMQLEHPAELARLIGAFVRRNP